MAVCCYSVVSLNRVPRSLRFLQGAGVCSVAELSLDLMISAPGHLNIMLARKDGLGSLNDHEVLKMRGQPPAP